MDAIEACGGQMTADGRRHRNGGGILWGIIKVREPKVYKEIMKKAKEFEVAKNFALLDFDLIDQIFISFTLCSYA